ncbi:50S ribosomal protein L23 [Sodalis-like secondary symbiont of Drepanosiphum platanoidis]|uniref:50S ribosomal protein L23 n=1 Tax=Sodalis-like secondary symbiont of Drepanosiphum platanoidis TaxID=2994493 RepID=UPI003463FFDD
MISEERLLKILLSPHLSEKTSISMEKKNTVVFKVNMTSSKLEIKHALNKLLNVHVINVNTMIVKGKIKGNNKKKGYRNNWKKAYITLKKGENLSFIDGAE